MLLAVRQRSDSIVGLLGTVLSCKSAVSRSGHATAASIGLALVWSLCLLAACKTLASTMDAPHASFCAVWVGNWSPRIVLTYQLLSSLGSRERRRVAPTTAVATSAQSDLSKCFEETLGLARTLSEPLLRRPQNLRHKSKLVVVSR